MLVVAVVARSHHTHTNKAQHEQEAGELKQSAYDNV